MNADILKGKQKPQGKHSVSTLKAKSTHTFTDKERKGEAKSGVAMSDGSFPIRNAQDLANARQAIGRAAPGKRAAVRAHIAKRAAALK